MRNVLIAHVPPMNVQGTQHTLKIFHYNYEGVHCGKKFFWILKFCFSSSKLPESHFSFSKNEAMSSD